MPNVAVTIRKALGQLHQERDRIDRQISALSEALATIGGRVRRRASEAKRTVKRARWKMTAAQKKAISRRMKAYWAKRKKA